jgi:hypothetical protein
MTRFVRAIVAALVLLDLSGCAESPPAIGSRLPGSLALAPEVTGTDPAVVVVREGIEDRDYLVESKGIFGTPEKVTPILNPQNAWLLADVLGR